MSAWQDCGTAGMAGKSIPGNIPAIEAMGLRYIPSLITSGMPKANEMHPCNRIMTYE